MALPFLPYAGYVLQHRSAAKLLGLPFLYLLTPFFPHCSFLPLIASPPHPLIVIFPPISQPPHLPILFLSSLIVFVPHLLIPLSP